MPLIKYKCSKDGCGQEFKKFFKTVLSVPPLSYCPQCGGDSSKRVLSAPSNNSVMTIDNGLTPRAVEVDQNIMEMRKERAYKEPDRGD